MASAAFFTFSADRGAASGKDTPFALAKSRTIGESLSGLTAFSKVASLNVVHWFAFAFFVAASSASLMLKQSSFMFARCSSFRSPMSTAACRSNMRYMARHWSTNAWTCLPDPAASLTLVSSLASRPNLEMARVTSSGSIC